jgi:hypothetical protein
MNNSYRLTSKAGIFVILAFLCSTASAQTSPTISYQGLLQNNGVAVNGTDTLTIRLYTAESGGSPIYSETQTVMVVNGIFNLAIGAVTPLLPTLDFTKQYYLGVSVDGAPELMPRSTVSFAPYAFRALNADSASYATHATTANTLSGSYVSNVNGSYGSITITGGSGISIANNSGSIGIGNSGVLSLNSAAGKLTLVGAGGTTIADTGTTITIHSATFTGGTGIQAVQNSDSSITITNGGGPIATISLGKQAADTGQVLRWNGAAWKPATLSGSSGPDSIKNLQDCRDDGSSVYLGAGSGTKDQGPLENAALGIGALSAVDDGSANTAVGFDALQSDTDGNSNTACGNLALETCLVGSYNSAFGASSLKGCQGSGNSAFGQEAMESTQAASYNCAFGEGCMYNNRYGTYNTAFGVSTMGDIDSGSFNVAVGYEALSYSLERSHLIAIGDSSLYRNGFSRSLNSAATLDSATANTAVGDVALFSNSTGSYNTGVGYHVLFSDSIGYRNTAVGYLAMNQNASGNDNTAVGSSAGPTSPNLNNTTTLGSGAQATLNNEVVLGNAGVTSLVCMGSYAATTANSANLVVLSTGQIARSTSSARYKTNIHDLDINTDKLYDLRPVSYTSKIDGKEYFGLVAEDVAKVVPELAEYAKSKDVIPGSKSEEVIPDAVKYPMLSVLLLEELKKEHAKSEEQEKTISAMERRLDALEASQKSAH